MSQYNRELEKIFTDLMEMKTQKKDLKDLARELRSRQRTKLYHKPTELLKLLSNYKQYQSGYANPLTCITFESGVPDEEMKILADSIAMHRYYIPICFVGKIEFTEEQQAVLKKYDLRWHVINNSVPSCR